AVQSAGSSSDTLKKSLDQVCQLIDSLQQNIASLENATQKASSVEGVAKQGEIYRDLVISAMNAVRKDADKLEMLVDAEIWPLPTYAEMIFLR
ncbi:MAG TPA: glutamine synthetase type III, partial [Armatimonadota bacterium]|nr:glutamine synthetase type III [Armatimonadota bacterium]